MAKHFLVCLLLVISLFQVGLSAAVNKVAGNKRGSKVTYIQSRAFTCPEADGSYATPRQCISQYYECVNGTAYPQTCQPGYLFDPITLVCTIAAETSCNQHFDCPSDGLYPYPGACANLYYVCSAGDSYLQYCPENYVFDPIALKCVPKEGATCTLSPTSTVPSTVPSPTTPSLPTTTTEPPTTTTTETPTTTTTETPTTTTETPTTTTEIPTTTTETPTTTTETPTTTTEPPTTTTTEPPTTTTTETPTTTTETPTTTTETPTTTTEPLTTTTEPLTTTTTEPLTTTTTETPTTTTETPTTTTTETPTTTTETPTTTTTETPTTTTTETPTTTTTTETPTTKTTEPPREESTTATTTSIFTTVTPGNTPPITTTTNTTPIKPVEPFICPQSDGLFPVPGVACSNKFWMCSNYYAYLMDCPEPIFYNPAIQVCDWKENIAGCH